MNHRNLIQENVEQICEYGSAMNITAEKNGMQSPIVPTVQPFANIHNGKGLSLYLNEVYDKLHPDKLVMVVKKKNGSSYINPKTFEIDFSTNEEPVQPTVMPTYSAPQMPMLGTPQQNSNPMIQVYQFQLQQVNAELAKVTQKAESFESKFIETRDRNYELQKDLSLIEERHSLEKTRKEIESQNTLGSVIKEFRPEIQEIITHVATKGKSEPVQQLGTAEETKNNAVLMMLNELDDSTFNEFFEILGRLGQVDATIRGSLLANLRTSTMAFNEAIAQLNQLKRK